MYLSDLLTEEQNDIRHMIRKFVDKEIMPIREKLEEDYGLVESVLQKLGGQQVSRYRVVRGYYDYTLNA